MVVNLNVEGGLGRNGKDLKPVGCFDRFRRIYIMKASGW